MLTITPPMYSESSTLTITPPMYSESSTLTIGVHR
jgi:hypothetical protein